MFKSPIATEQAWNTERFLRRDMPTLVPRQLTPSERAVFHRILSMLGSMNAQENYLVQADIKSVCVTVWFVVHHPELKVTSYMQAVDEIDKLPIGSSEREQIFDLRQFIIAAFGVNPTEPMSLFAWIEADRDRRARWEATEMSICETHIKYFEYLLANC